MVRKHTKNCPVPLVPTTVDLQVILNEVLAKYKILRVPTKSIHLENGGASPLTFPPVAHLRVNPKCSWKLLSSYIGLVSSVRSFFFFYLGFLSRTFANHRTAGEGGGHFFNSSLPLSPASLSSWAITVESSPLHIASTRTRSENLRLPLTTSLHTLWTCHHQDFFITEKGKLHHFPLKP